MTKIFLLTKSLVESQDYLNNFRNSPHYVIARNGLFVVDMNYIFSVREKASDLPSSVEYQQIGNDDKLLAVDAGFDLNVMNEFRIEEARRAVAFLKSVHDKYHAEAFLVVLYHPEHGFRVTPIYQQVSAAGLKYEGLEKIYRRPGEFIAGDWHSHPGSGKPHHSGTDEHDEASSTGIHLISSNLKDTHIDDIVQDYTYINLTYRNTRHEIKPEHLFTLPEPLFDAKEIEDWVTTYVQESKGSPTIQVTGNGLGYHALRFRDMFESSKSDSADKWQGQGFLFREEEEEKSRRKTNFFPPEA